MTKQIYNAESKRGKMNKGMRQQQGAALFIAMLILPLLLVLGILVMNNSFLGLKMVDARVLQGESNILLNSAASDIMHSTNIAASFAAATDDQVFTSNKAGGIVTGKIEINGELNCRRRMQASGSNFKCRYLELELVHDFGRNTSAGTKAAKNVMGLGIEQPIIVD